MKKYTFYFWICTVNVLLTVNTYKIPNFNTEVLNHEFRLSIPGEPDMKFVFYVMEINEKCPIILDYISQPHNNLWISNQFNTTLLENDNIVISVIVHHQNGIYKAVRNFDVRNKKLILSPTKIRQNSNFPDNCKHHLIEEITTCVASTSTSDSSITINPCVGDLIFEEDFNELSLERWTYDIRLRLYADETEEFSVYDNANENSFVKDGVLYIVPTVTSKDIRQGSLDLGKRCTAVSFPQMECDVTAQHLKVLPPVYSAQIHTKNSFNFKYGRIEIKAKLPKGDWLLPYIVLQPSTSHSETYHAPQIRIAFARGNAHYTNSSGDDVGGSRLYGGIILWQNSFNIIESMMPDMREIKHEKHFGDDFHIYSLIWNKDSISVALDGKTFGEISEHMLNFRQKFFIILGVSCAGHLWFEETKNSTKPWINTSNKAILNFWRKRNEWQTTWTGGEAMKIDYVRVYAI